MTSPYGTGTVTPFALSGNINIDAFANIGIKWGSGGQGVGAVVTYSFPKAGAAWISDYNDGEPFDGFQAFNAVQQNAARQALTLWSDVANITFQEVPDTANDVGDIRFGFSRVVTNSTAAAWAYYPYANPNYEFPEAGDIWLDAKYPPNLQMTPGKFGFSTLLHEIGHAIGLDHPFNDGYGEPVLPPGFDNLRYTVMSYTPVAFVDVEPMTPMLLDILAVQYIYGANMSTRTGDDVYKFSTTQQLRAIWDAGGIDTIDASNQTVASIINLDDGEFSSIGRRVYGVAAENIGIAYGVTIENAKGGSGADKIFGNDVANVLSGNAGNDTLDGELGADTLRGGRGNDIYIIGDGDTIDEQGNRDLGDEVRITTSVDLTAFAGGVIERATAVGDAAVNFTGNKAANILIGNAATNILDGASGVDILKGGGGNDLYYVDAATDRIDEGTNKDSADEVRSTVAINLTTLGKGQIEIATLLGTKSVGITGNTQNNIITGNSGANILNGGGGNDTLIGADGNDTIVDKIGHNSLKGGNGNDTLTTGAGNDLLDGGAGIDVLAGGTGDDTYFVDDLKDKVTDSGTKDLNDSVVASISIDLTTFAGGLLEHVTLIGDADLQAIGNNRDNTLIGNDGNNLLVGSLGNDSLDGGQGADTMQGGNGNDSYVVDEIGDIVDEQGNSDAGDKVRTALSIDLVTFASGAIEHAELSDTATDAFGNAADNNLTGNGAANTLEGREGNDVLLGEGGTDLLVGGTGNDVLDGGIAYGSDTLKGGAGNDVYYVYNYFDGDVVDEEGNNDTADEIRVAFSVDLSTFAGGAIENATALGNSFVDLTGNAGANVLVANGIGGKLDGGGGDDLLIGGDGSDSYVIDSAGDVIVEKTANLTGDTVYTSAISLDLTTLSNGNLENVTLSGALDLDIVGNGEFNTLKGNDGNNKIDGGAKDDHLSGGGGNDYIIAGTGHDYLNGDGGDDTLVAMPRVAVRIDGGTGTDTLLIAVESKIDLRPNVGGFGSFVQDIEIIDVLNGGRDDVQLDEASLRSMSSSTDQLIIRGEVGDIVRLAAGFVDQGDTSIDGVSYSILSSNGATLLIESGVELREQAISSISLKDAVQIHGKGDDALGMYAAGVGDFNNDGTDDLVFGALQGNAWVAFGSPSGYSQDIATHPLDVPGVTISGDGLAPVGYEVAGGNDINGDGISDILVQNPGEIVSGQLRGGAFVVFGSSSLAALDLNAMTAAEGFKITASAAIGKALGSVSTVADFNGDGYDDFLVGAPGYGSGQAYLVLGRASSPGGSIALAPGNGVFQITGKNASSFGQTVSDAGDLNGDGYNDIVISGANQTEIIYGRKGSTMPSFANGANSAVVNWATSSSQSLGDINGDGYNDLVLIQGNMSLVLFGKGAQFTTSSLSEIDYADSIRVEGLVSFAGDINADGYDDIVVRNAVGLEADAAVVLYGHSGSFDHWISFPMLNENDILRITPDDPGALSYLATAAGDTNGDGFDDLLVGTPYSKADPGSSGILYQLAGRDFRDEIDLLGTAAGDSLTGTALGDRIVAAQGNDVVVGGGGADVINAGQGNDELHVGDNKFFRIDGGAGIDTLHLDYAGAIDFGNLDGNAGTSDRGRISNVEILDVANGFANAMTLHLADILDFDVTIANVGGKASLDNVLRIDGEAGDTLHMFKADGWSSANTSALTGYAIYSYQAVKVAIDTDIAVSIT